MGLEDWLATLGGLQPAFSMSNTPSVMLERWKAVNSLNERQLDEIPAIKKINRGPRKHVIKLRGISKRVVNRTSQIQSWWSLKAPMINMVAWIKHDDSILQPKITRSEDSRVHRVRKSGVIQYRAIRFAVDSSNL